MRRDLLLLIAAMRAYDAVHALRTCDDCGASWADDVDECRWCATYRATQAETVLRPPAPRGYGFATAVDLAGLGIDPAADRETDLRRWAQDLRMAVDAGVITETQADAAWRSTRRERRAA